MITYDPATDMYRVPSNLIDWRTYTRAAHLFARLAASLPATSYAGIDATLFVCEFLSDAFAHVAGVERERGEA